MDDRPPLTPYTIHSAESGARKRHALEAETAKCLDSTGGFSPGQGGTVVGAPEPVAFRTSALDTPREDGLTPPLGCHANAEGYGGADVMAMTPQDAADAALAARLERDGFLAAVPYDPPPDGPRYAAMGDAVTVNVIEWIGVRLVSALDREESHA